MEIFDVTDKRFKKYGKVITNIDFAELIKGMKNTPIPKNVVYEPSVRELEELNIYKTISDVFFGEMPIQIGYCNGHNDMLNALEYHRSSEINLAVTNIVLMLGSEQDITDEYTYDTSNVELFRVPEGMAIELYATTLHYAPCNTDDYGFRVCVILPKGTNIPLSKIHAGGEDALLTAKNKWLIGHPDADLADGCNRGLIGINIKLNGGKQHE